MELPCIICTEPTDRTVDIVAEQYDSFVADLHVSICDEHDLTTEAIVLKVGKQLRRVNEARLLNDLHEVSKKLGHKAQSREYDELGAWTYPMFYNYFGDWETAIQQIPEVEA